MLKNDLLKEKSITQKSKEQIFLKSAKFRNNISIATQKSSQESAQKSTRLEFAQKSSQKSTQKSNFCVKCSKKDSKKCSEI